MQDMIRRIIEADSEAKAIEESNKIASEKEKQKIENKAAAIYWKYMDEAKAEIEKNNNYLEKQTARKLAEASAKHESVLIKLKSVLNCASIDFSRELACIYKRDPIETCRIRKV